MTEGHIASAADLVVGLRYVDEVPVVEDRLPIVKVGLAGDEVPGGQWAKQDVGDMPDAVQGARLARMRLVRITVHQEPPGHYLLPGSRRMVLLGVSPQHRRARIGLNVFACGEVEGQPRDIAGDVPR